jgi:hypothetical protein
MRRRSVGSILISNLDSELKERILNLDIKKDRLKKFDEEEDKERISQLVDLRDIYTKTETELYRTLNLMVGNGQYFIYCGPLLININPGPNLVNDYLNLESWVIENHQLPETQWKPHLYSYINYVYQTLIKEDKDQVVNMLGQIGTGKTFNLVHIFEYFCYIACPEDKQVETFDVIHRSIQLIHLTSSIFRQNNMESTSCGLLLHLGFDEDNNIAGFDFEANILDYTLPFSENGRSFSILHSLMAGANSEIKKLLELPESIVHLNFFRKYHNSFSELTKEKFKLNDLEIWTKFHSLLNYFKVPKSEIMEILQLMAFILLCNEASINKKKSKNGEETFMINKGISSRKLAKNLNISEDDFLNRFGSYKSMTDIKNNLIGLIKYSYYMIFDFIKLRIKNYLSGYFGKPAGRVKYIHFIDVPGEVEDQTLGGLTTNLINECLNVYAGSQYLSVVNRLFQESLNMRYFQPLHSCYVVDALMGKYGLFKHLSKPFTEDNFNTFLNTVNTKAQLAKTIKFEGTKDQFVFNLKYPHKVIPYSYESLYYESKSLLLSKSIMKVFEGSKNSIVKKTLANYTGGKNIYTLMQDNIKKLFKPLEGLNPFVIYCLHSNNSHKIFFGENNKEKDTNWLIPFNLTVGIIKNSLTLPVLYWEWFGFHEWIEINDFVKEFVGDFEKVKKTLLAKKAIKDINLKDLSSYETATYILAVVSDPRQYFLGSKHLVMRKGTLSEIRKVIKNIYEGLKDPSYFKRGSNSSIIRSQSSGDELAIQDKKGKEFMLRRRSMKVQCHLNIIGGGSLLVNLKENTVTGIYDLFNIVFNEKNPDLCTESTPNNVDLTKFRRDNNIIVANHNQFMIIKNLFNNDKNQNFDIFDYSDFIPDIVRLQSALRALKARKKYKIYRYVIKRITMMQKHIRGIITRNKFQRFIYVVKFVRKLQRAYRLRYNRKIKSIIMIQKLIRNKLAYNKLIRLVETLNRASSGIGSKFADSRALYNNDFYDRKGITGELEHELYGLKLKSRKSTSRAGSAFDRSQKLRLPSQKVQRVPKKTQSNTSLQELCAETDKGRILEILLNDIPKKSNNYLFTLARSNLNNSGISNNDIPIPYDYKRTKCNDTKKVYIQRLNP